MAASLPPVSSLPSLSAEKQGDIISLLFEPAPTLVALSTPLLSSETFESYDEMIDAVGVAIQELQTSRQLTKLDDILSAHPRLGEKKVDSALSRAEQKAMTEASGGTGAAEKEAQILQELNAKYEATFPGLRYVVFVNGRSRTVIFEDMNYRIGRADIDQERKEAIKAMLDIAKDRAHKIKS